MQPRLWYGAPEGVLLTPDTATFADDEAPYQVLALTNVSAPAGPAGECIFPILHLTTRRFSDCELVVTPIVDEVELEAQTITLAGATGVDGVVDVTELDLSQPYPSAIDEQIRNAPRGSSIQVRVECDPEGRVEVSVLQVEYEIVRESRVAV